MKLTAQLFIEFGSSDIGIQNTLFILIKKALLLYFGFKNDTAQVNNPKDIKENEL